MPTYKIKTQEENNLVLSKSDFEIDFTVESVKEHINYLIKKKKELTAQKGLESAKMENIKSFHPEVLELTPEKRNAIALYDKAEAVYKACEDGLANVDKQFAEYAIELAEIEKQTGIKVVEETTEKVA